jgi:hypothetical protein
MIVRFKNTDDKGLFKCACAYSGVEGVEVSISKGGGKYLTLLYPNNTVEFDCEGVIDVYNENGTFLYCM